ncbi:hypothetical protein [Nocardia alni]|uniref:hypothetical protein n=1 Tax=Nocardia alni TaxID=2815723 RepID=UPI001C225E95|nr:hypothetical protein [Nocardia alni]
MSMWLPYAALGLVIAVVAAVLGRVVMSPIAHCLGPVHGPMLARFAAVLIWGVGLVAALARIGVPTSVTVPILSTVLIIVGGTLVLLIAGGLSRPVRQPRLHVVERATERAGDRDDMPEILERDVLRDGSRSNPRAYS